MKVQLKIDQDTDNSNCDDLYLTLEHIKSSPNLIYIKLESPDREICVNIKDIDKAIQILKD